MPLPLSVGLGGDRTATAALLKKFFPTHTPQQVAAAAGMVLPHLRVNFFNAGTDTLGVEAQGVGDTHLTRYFVPDKDPQGNPTGTLTLKHESQWVDKQFRGEGHKRFAEQLQHLDRLGGLVSRIHIPLAAGSAEGNSRRSPQQHTLGYSVWPKYGFNAKLEDHHLEDLSPELKEQLKGKPQDTHSLFGIEGGAEEWHNKGQQLFNLNFDLAPNSEHRKRFGAYYAHREAKAAGVPSPTGGTSGEGTAVSGSPPTGTGATEEGNRYAAKRTALGRVLRRLKVKYKQTQTEKLVGGKGDGKSNRHFDRKALLKGTEGEREHTSDPKEAEEIAKDHLTESGDYYDKLELTEKQPLSRLRKLLAKRKPVTKYVEEKGNFSPLVSHAAAALEEPLSDGAMASFLDHLQEAHPDDPVVQKFGEWAAGSDSHPLASAYKQVLHDPRGPTAEGKTVLHFLPRSFHPNYEQADEIFKTKEGSWLRGKKEGADDFEWDGSEPLTTAEVAQHLYQTGGPANLAFALMAARYFSPQRQAEIKQGKRTNRPTFYSTEKPVEAHPSVKGFQLEHALRRAISDPETSSDLKALSHTLLTKGVERSDAAYGINDEVEQLPEDHWLKKAGYNWLSIPHKLHLDAAVGHGIDSVVRLRKQQLPDLHDLYHRFASTEAIAHFVENPEDFDTADRSAAHSAAQEAAQELLKIGPVSDLHDSLERHQTRNQSLRNADPTFRGHKTSLEQEQTTAAQPLVGWPDRYAAKGKNPEGGLTVAEARRQGIQPGSRTKAEAEKAGGFSKIEGKTQKRRKSFCARACGQAKQFPKAAKDPESRLRKALRIWGCRCPSKNAAEEKPVKYQSPALSEFITTVRQIRSDNQEVRRKIAEEQYKKLGLKATVRDAIADWPHSASANTAQAVAHNGDLDKVRAGAALYGIQTNSPQLLLFHEHSDGKDLLHKFDAQGSAERLRQQLDAAGLLERTLSPTPTGWSVFFFDPKGQLQPKLSAFTQQAGYNLETSRGTGERIGDDQQAEADRGDRADYRKFIRQYEKQQGIN